MFKVLLKLKCVHHIGSCAEFLILLQKNKEKKERCKTLLTEQAVLMMVTLTSIPGNLASVQHQLVDTKEGNKHSPFLIY